MAKERKVKKVQARHILVGSKELAEELKVKIDEGAEFTKLAEEHSECPSKKRGGDLGWFGKGAMVRPFEVAAFTAQEGDVVGPIHTEFGWHLIYVYEIQEDIDPDAGPPTGDEDAEGEDKPSGRYDREANQISLYSDYVLSKEEILRNVVHEYTHYKQPEELFQKYIDQGYTYQNSPLELEALKTEEEWWRFA